MVLPRVLASALLFSGALVISAPAQADPRSDGQLQKMSAGQAGWVNEQGKPVTGKEGSKRSWRDFGRHRFDGKPVRSFFMVNGKVTKETVTVTTGAARSVKTSGLTGTISGATSAKNLVSHSETTVKRPAVMSGYSQTRTVTSSGASSYTSLPAKAVFPRTK